MVGDERSRTEERARKEPYISCTLTYRATCSVFSTKFINDQAIFYMDFVTRMVMTVMMIFVTHYCSLISNYNVHFLLVCMFIS